MTLSPNSIIGVILAGGLSRRMGVGDKGLLDLAGKPMLAHVIDRLAPQVAGIVINANGDPRRFAPFGLPVVADTIDGFAGPLAGILSGMLWSRANAPAASHVATVSADTPLLPTDLIARLGASLHAGGREIGIARSPAGLHPVIALWPVALAEDLQAALEIGIRKVLEWADRHDTVPVDFPSLTFGGTEIDPFFNANTPDDLAEIRRFLAG